jgi:multiple antibiotic resistance protein
MTSLLLSIYLNAFFTLVVIVDPVGTAAAFIAMAGGRDRSFMRVTAYRAVTIALLLLLFFGLCGEVLLRHLGITLPAFRIAGGLLLFVTASRMIFGQNESEEVQKDKDEFQKRDIAVFPLAIPLLAGPGCMTAIILLMSKAQGVIEGGIVILALLTTHIVALACLLLAHPIQRLLGSSGTNIVARVMGIILAAMSVQFVADGLHGMQLAFNG